MKSLPQIVLAAVCAALAVIAGPAEAAEIGQIKNTAGQVFLLRNNNQQPANSGDIVEQADIVITGINSSVGITLIDNSRLSAGPNSRVEFKQFRFNPTTQEGESLTQLHRGTLAIVSRDLYGYYRLDPYWEAGEADEYLFPALPFRPAIQF